MLKRRRDGDGDGDFESETSPLRVDGSTSSVQAPKRQKLGAAGHHQSRRSSNAPHSSSILALESDRLTSLPHELIIRILHLLPFKCVLLCQLVSHQMRYLAGDAQVWKGLYYDRFVRPRVMRLRGISGTGRVSGNADRSDGVGHGVDGKGDKERYAAGEDRSLQKSRSRGPDGDRHENGRKGPRNNKPVEIPVFSSRESKWLDEGWLLGDESGSAEQSGRETGRSCHRYDAGIESGNGKGRGGKRIATDWKARYKLRYNWSIGAAEVKEISLCPSPDCGIEDTEEEKGDFSRESKSFIARLGDGVVITVNTKHGLRAWDLKTRQCVAQSIFIAGDEGSNENNKVPTCLAVDGTSGGEDTGVAIGFRNGYFEVWRLRVGDDGQRSFESQWKSPRRQRGDELSGVAYEDPQVLTITASQVLSVYIIDRKEVCDAESPMTTKEFQDNFNALDSLDTSSHDREADPRRQFDEHGKQPRLLTSLRSHTSWPPLYLSIRSTPHSIIASIAYSLPTYLSGWSVGLQELHLSSSGSVLKSRLASAIEQGFHSLLSPSPSSTPPTLSSSSIHDDGPYHHSGAATLRAPHPTSLSYSHPYLLASNRDNTLTLYLVTSNNEELKISKGTTLWGHTSSVSGAQVGGRGKAVSISARGDELRVWELEAGLGKKMVGRRSVRVKRDGKEKRTETADTRGWISKIAERDDEDRYIDNGWVGFDDEVVIVLRDEGVGDSDGDGNEQKLVVYDFT